MHAFNYVLTCWFGCDGSVGKDIGFLKRNGLSRTLWLGDLTCAAGVLRPDIKEMGSCWLLWFLRELLMASGGPKMPRPGKNWGLEEPRRRCWNWLLGRDLKEAQLFTFALSEEPFLTVTHLASCGWNGSVLT